MSDNAFAPTVDNHRLLVVDDNPSIHEDFRKILPAKKNETTELDELLMEILEEEDDGVAADAEPEYEIDHAYQGEEALEMVRKAEESGNPYALLFMDVRMPPGWDGIETIRRIWKEFPHSEIVICTAYSDYSWEDILEEVGSSDQLQFLRKPFDVVSIKQMALALTRKWNLSLQSRRYTENLERDVNERTRQLSDKVEELEKALAEIQQLQGILPMCAWCHKIRNDDDYWQQVDEYLSSRPQLEISHGICPDCYEKMMDKVGTDTNHGENMPASAELAPPTTAKDKPTTDEPSSNAADDTLVTESPKNGSSDNTVIGSPTDEVGDHAVSGDVDLLELRRQMEEERKKNSS